MAFVWFHWMPQSTQYHYYINFKHMRVIITKFLAQLFDKYFLFFQFLFSFQRLIIDMIPIFFLIILTCSFYFYKFIFITFVHICAHSSLLTNISFWFVNVYVGCDVFKFKRYEPIQIFVYLYYHLHRLHVAKHLLY